MKAMCTVTIGMNGRLRGFMTSSFAPILGCLASAHVGDAADRIELVCDGSPISLQVVRANGGVYVSAQPLLDAFDAHIEGVNDDAVSVCVGEGVCALVRTDGSDDRMAHRDGSWLMSLAAVPDLLRAHYSWDADAETVAIESGPARKRSGLQAGDPFPDMALPDMDGTAVAFTEFRGRKVALFTWASW